MDLLNVLFMKKYSRILPYANIAEIMLARRIGEVVRSIVGNPLNFRTKSAQEAISTKVSMNPIQNLNGYEYPWPAGGGKNKLDTSTEVVGSYIKDDGTIGTSGNASYYDQYIPVTEGQTYTASFTIATDNPGYYFRIHGYDTDKEWVQMLFKSSTTIASAGDYSFSCIIPSGIKYVRISFGTYARNIMLEQSSTATNYAPYSNICPISGRTSVELNGCGKNMYEFPFKNKLSLSGSGNNRTVVNTLYNQASIIKLKPNTNYVLSGDRTEASDVYARLATFGSYPKAGDVSIRFLSYKNDTGLTFTTSDDELWALVFETSGYDDDCHMQLELGSIATEYEQFAESNDVTITFGETVYGGTLDVETGVLSIDKLYKEFTGSASEVWTSTNIGDYRVLRITKDEQVISSDSKAICNMYKNGINSAGIGVGIFYIGALNYVFQTDLSVSDWRTYLSENNLQLCASLATPITVQLTPQEVELLKGINNIWTDGDVIELTYKA